MSTYTYTHAYTRAQAVVDQVDVLLNEAGIDDYSRAKVCTGVGQRWLEAVGLFLERNGEMVYEIAVRIHWSAHSDQAELEFSTDLPGWEGTASPEAIILGRRFAAVAQRERLSPRFWVRFTPAIRSDPAKHQRLCTEVGVVYRRGVPEWGRTPTTRSIRLQDLGEISMSERSTL